MDVNQYIAVTAAEMKEIEKNADAAGLSYYQMMENAGTAAYNILIEKYPEADTIAVFAGKGNNAGDGFVLARLAAADGYQVYVVLVEGLPVTQDAVKNYELLEGLPVKVMNLDDIGSAWCLTGKTVIADAIYGTGFHGSLRPSGEKACRWINDAKCPVVALDLPSGTNADTGEAAEGAVKADFTVTFHLPKPVHVSETAAEYCGIVEIADIGIR